MSFLGCVYKRADLVCMALNANELHIPTPSPEEGIFALPIYSNKQLVEAT